MSIAIFLFTYTGFEKPVIILPNWSDRVDQGARKRFTKPLICLIAEVTRGGEFI